VPDEPEAEPTFTEVAIPDDLTEKLVAFAEALKSGIGLDELVAQCLRYHVETTLPALVRAQMVARGMSPD
jgi:hypothetical protein